VAHPRVGLVDLPARTDCNWANAHWRLGRTVKLPGNAMRGCDLLDSEWSAIRKLALRLARR
jgi:hypothetical protein